MSTATSAPATSAPATRVSVPRLLVVLVTTALVVWGGVRAVTSAFATPVIPGQTGFSAYVDVTATPSYPFETPAGPAQSNVVLAFVVAAPGAPCTPSWGGAYTLDQAGSALQLDRRLAQLRLTGGSARVSFGGQRGGELATTCTDPTALRSAYARVIDRYRLTGIDLDLEGATLSDSVAMARRAAAIAAVQADEAHRQRPVSVWLTLPVGVSGLDADGLAAVTTMLDAGVDVAGVNGMTMDFGSDPTTSSMASQVIASATALEGQVSDLFSAAGQRLTSAAAWSRVGITPMIGQNDVVTERFTLDDASSVNAFAREHGVGELSMWSLNRDSTCGPPLPSVLTVVQTSCSGVDQGQSRFAEVLSAGSGPAAVPTGATRAPTSAAASTSSPGVQGSEDDPAHSPFPIWDPMGTYPTGTKIVWHHQVYQARYWTTGFAPDTPVANLADSPWTLIGPVLPGDTPAPLPTLPPGTYPQWDPTAAYVAGSRVQLGLVPYQAKWWTRGQSPGSSVPGGSPWVLVTPGS